MGINEYFFFGPSQLYLDIFVAISQILQAEKEVERTLTPSHICHPTAICGAVFERKLCVPPLPYSESQG